MGIQGLLPLMKGAETSVSLSKLQDTIAAIDTNGWIHRACYSCADRIYMGEPTEMYIYYCINFCKTLRNHRITPILVFDGQSLPAKSETKLARQKRKEEKREEIRELLRKGREREARWLMRQCVDVTFEMCRNVIERCRQENIDCLVAPFEADAQIAYLVNNNLADYAITEDSDLLAFGCKRALYKLDRDEERGRMIDLSRLNKCFKNMNFQKFQLFCILSGCDYISNIPGVGIGRARKFFESLNENPTAENLPQILEKIPFVLNMIGKVKVTKEYIKDFIHAVQTFNHQIVYSPQFDRLVHLNPLTSDIDPDEFKLYGGDFFIDGDQTLPNNLKFVTNYALGNICPKTLDILDSFKPCNDVTETSNECLWFSSVFNERIDKAKNSSIESNSNENESFKSIIENVDNNNQSETNHKPRQKLNDHSITRKRSTIIHNSSTKKSKYFLNDDNDSPKPKKITAKFNESESSFESYSSIDNEDNEDAKILLKLNENTIHTTIKTSYRRSSSLYSQSSAMTNDSASSTSSSTNNSQTMELIDNQALSNDSSSMIIQKLMNISESDTSVKKKIKRKSNRKSSTTKKSPDIRKYLNKN